MKTERSSGVDQCAELGRLTGMSAHFGQAMPYRGGGYGEAILTRFAPELVRNHVLPARPGSEPRSALEIRCRIGGRTVRFVGTHLDHQRNPADRLAQVEELLRAIPEDGLPSILAGDLNAVPGRPEMERLLATWRDAAGAAAAPTYPSKEPRKRIDWVLLRPRARWRVVESRVLAEEVASDHRPLLTVLELVPPE